MLRAFNAAVRPRSPWRLPRTLAVITAAAAMLTGPLTAEAAQAQTGSVEVDGLAFAIDYTCLSTCQNFAPGAMSSGSISGTDTLGPFTVAWAAPPVGATNLTQSIFYSPTCDAGVATGAFITSSTVSISGALLTYNSSTNMAATVTLTFTGQLVEGAFVPFTSQVVISGGGYTITVQGFTSPPGDMVAASSSSPAGCSGTRDYTASGVFLTLGDT